MIVVVVDEYGRDSFAAGRAGRRAVARNANRHARRESPLQPHDRPPLDRSCLDGRAAILAPYGASHHSERADPMNPDKALWEKGGFTRIAQSMRESGEALIKSIGITRGLKVLDLGCGDGTTAFLQRELEALFTSQNTSASAGVTSMPATFLRVTAAL